MEKDRDSIRNIEILDLNHYSFIFLKDMENNRDKIQAYCIQKGFIDLKRFYDFKIFECFNTRELFVVIIKQKPLKSKVIAECLLPFGLEEHFLLNTLFCFKNTLVFFYQGKILYAQRYDNFSDIYSCFLKVKEEFNIEIGHIFVHQKYETLKEKQQRYEDVFGEKYLKNFIDKCLNKKPDLFFESHNILRFKKSFLLPLVIVFLFVVFDFYIDIQLKNHISNPDRNFKQTDTFPAYFSRYLLVANLSQLAYENNVFFENIEFVSQGNNFVLGLKACALSQDLFMRWAQEVNGLLRVKNFVYSTFEKNSNFYCAYIGWKK